MINKILSLSPIIQTLFATTFTWLVTLFGALLVYFFKKINKTIMDIMLSFAAGIMIAASFFSLLLPAINMKGSIKIEPWIVVSMGLILGGAFLFIGDKIYDFYEKKHNNSSNSLKRCIMLIFSITLHNIPEGMAIGIAFGSVKYAIGGAALIKAWQLALGIGLQNFPEGAAISMPLLREGMSRNKSFFIGQLSAIVEPIFGVIGAILVIKIKAFLPFFLSFAAGAMIYVVVEELIPESQTNNKKSLMTLFTIIGFITMMILDIALG